MSPQRRSSVDLSILALTFCCLNHSCFNAQSPTKLPAQDYPDMTPQFTIVLRVVEGKVILKLCYLLLFFLVVIILCCFQDKDDFELSTLPALVPVFTSASGETLLLLVKHADLIINKVIMDIYEVFFRPLGFPYDLNAMLILS